MIKSLYIHIPFCEHICSYCDFPKVFHNEALEEKYFVCLLDEIESYSIPDDSLDTIYIGGGTPTCLNHKAFDQLLEYLHTHFPHLKEWTVEANPESLSEDKIQMMKKYGVNRVSIGVESTNDSILKELNRKHCVIDVTRCLSLLKKYDFNNINLDFIYGVMNMTKEDLRRDIDFALSAEVTHLSFYSLQIEEGTVLYNKRKEALDDEEMRKSYDLIRKELHKKGFERYEVSNFAKKGYESLHNLNYWFDGMYYAAGLGASGYIDDFRYKNTLSLTKYLSHQYLFSKEPISIYDKEFEYLMLHLRLVKGFSIAEFNSLFHKDFLKFYKTNIEEVKDYIQIDQNNHFSIKDQYLYTMDQILLSLLILPEDLK